LQTGKYRKIMASAVKRYGNWALVAGAAEGIGRGFVSVLAARGYNIILVDRNVPAMTGLSQNIRLEYGVETTELALDLAAPDAAARCMEAVSRTGCRLLVYVAASSKISTFTKLDAGDIEGFLDVNTRTLLRLIHAFSRDLVQQGRPGGIILLSSLAGLVGPQFSAVYAATKSFSIRLTEALYDELKPAGVDILACCPGPVSTPAYWQSKPNLDKIRPSFTSPQQVAGYAMRNLGRRMICIPGLANRLQYFFLLNLIPRRLARRLVNQAMKRMYGER